MTDARYEKLLKIGSKFYQMAFKIAIQSKTSKKKLLVYLDASYPGWSEGLSKEEIDSMVEILDEAIEYARLIMEDLPFRARDTAVSYIPNPDYAFGE